MLDGDWFNFKDWLLLSSHALVFGFRGPHMCTVVVAHTGVLARRRAFYPESLHWYVQRIQEWQSFVGVLVAPASVEGESLPTFACYTHWRGRAGEVASAWRRGFLIDTVELLCCFAGVPIRAG